MIRKKGSFTVEAAMGFPIFFFAVIALIGMITWFQKVEVSQVELTNKARTLSATAYTTDKLLDKVDMNLTDDIFLIAKPHNGIVMRKFIGVDKISGTDNDENDEIVYITPHGEVYHNVISCTYIKAQISTHLYGTMDKKYIPCSKCAKGKTLLSATQVYIAKYGVRYHVDSTCNDIEKNAIAVRKSQTEGKRPCSKCCNEE